MLKCANFKVNLGLYVTEKREDGFHNLETIFLPVETQHDKIYLDAVQGDLTFSMEGGDFHVDAENNLCVKAFRLLQKEFQLPNVEICLEKNIPSGAGLGGGSADAAAVLDLTNQHFSLGLSHLQLRKYAAQLGSDVPFFIENKPMYATGRGEILQEIDFSLKDLQISVFKPNFSISTAEAYAHTKPISGRTHLCDLIHEPVEKWQNVFPNDFEASLFPSYPILAEIKQKFYDLGASYAALSGSGSAIFAIASHRINLEPFFSGQNL